MVALANLKKIGNVVVELLYLLLLLLLHFLFLDISIINSIAPKTILLLLLYIK